jgi:predicted acyltransferase
MPRVIYIDRSVLPKSKSKSAPRVCPPAPKSDLMAVLIRPSAARVKLAAPAKHGKNAPTARGDQPVGKQPTPQTKPLVYVQKIAPDAGSGTGAGKTVTKPGAKAQPKPKTKIKSGQPSSLKKVSKTRQGIAKAKAKAKIALKAVYPTVKSIFGKIRSGRPSAPPVRHQIQPTPKSQAAVPTPKTLRPPPPPAQRPNGNLAKAATPPKQERTPKRAAQTASPQKKAPVGKGRSRPAAKIKGLAYDFTSPGGNSTTGNTGTNPSLPVALPLSPPSRRPVPHTKATPAPVPIAKAAPLPTKPTSPPPSCSPPRSPQPQARRSEPGPAPAAKPAPPIISDQSAPSHAPVPVSPPKTALRAAPARLRSLDAYRGFIMLLLASGGFGIAQMAGQDGSNTNWEIAGWFFTHVSWVGMSTWDLIQPAFMFMVGVAAPYSYARRKELGQSWVRMFGHAASRAAMLVLLGVFLQSQAADHTNWQFTNVLTQIGLGYLVVFLFCGKGSVTQITGIAVILIGYAGAFFIHVGPESGLTLADFQMADSDVMPGMLAPYSMHINFAAGFDRWLLNLFPRMEPWLIHPGGYQTLNFIPSIATMLLGVLAGELLRGKDAPTVKFQKLLLAGVPCLVIGIFAGVTFCPIVKRIWTPSWALFSGAFVVWGLAIFYYLIDVRQWRWWSWPLVVVGMNSILIYFMAQLLKPWFASLLEVHVDPTLFSGEYGPVIQSCSVLAVMWLICAFLYRRKIFLRI